MGYNSAEFVPGPQSTVAQVDSAAGSKQSETEDVGSSPTQGNSFFMEFHILQNTIDYVTKVGLWLRLKQYV